jgi:hypothetical protein
MGGKAMSIRVMSSVWEDSKQKGNGLLLMLALADFADDQGKCYPSVDRLAFKTRMSRRNVQNLSRQLVEDGEISITENAGKNGCNIYQIMGVQTLHPCKSAPGSGIEGGAKASPAVAPEPSRTTSLDPSQTSSASDDARRKEVHKEFVDLWEEAFQMQFGRKYIFQDKDWKPLKNFISKVKLSAGEIMAVVTKAWAKPVDRRMYFNCNRSRDSIQAFCGCYNAIQSELETVRPGDIAPRNGHVVHRAAEEKDDPLYYAPGEKRA